MAGNIGEGEEMSYLLDSMPVPIQRSSHYIAVMLFKLVIFSI